MFNFFVVFLKSRVLFSHKKNVIFNQKRALVSSWLRWSFIIKHTILHWCKIYHYCNFQGLSYNWARKKLLFFLLSLLYFRICSDGNMKEHGLWKEKCRWQICCQRRQQRGIHKNRAVTIERCKKQIVLEIELVWTERKCNQQRCSK